MKSTFGLLLKLGNKFNGCQCIQDGNNGMWVMRNFVVALISDWVQSSLWENGMNFYTRNLRTWVLAWSLLWFVFVPSCKYCYIFSLHLWNQSQGRGQLVKLIPAWPIYHSRISSWGSGNLFPVQLSADVPERPVNNGPCAWPIRRPRWSSEILASAWPCCCGIWRMDIKNCVLSLMYYLLNKFKMGKKT